MCTHKYKKIGYLLAHTDRVYGEHFYAGRTYVPNIAIHQCVYCGKVKLESGIIEDTVKEL